MPHRLRILLVLTVAAFAASVSLSSAQRGRQGAPVPAARGRGPAATGPMAEEVFTNIRVLKGVPADEFLASMGFISNALAVNCTYCHLGEGGGGWAEYAK